MTVNEQVFKSKADLWLLIVLWGSIGMCLFGILNLNSGVENASALRMEVTPALRVISLILLTASIGLVLSILFYTRYIIRDRKLIVRCGPFVQRIEIGSIRTVKRKARTILSSPRLSMDTLGIQYNKYDDAFLSPRRKEDFIRVLKTINPSIEVQ